MSETTTATETPDAPNIRVRIGRFLFTYRNLVFPVATLLLLIFMKPTLFGGTLESDLTLDVVGFAIATLGQLLRAVVIGLAYIKRGGKDRQIDAPKLVRQGVFSLSRNPLYVGNLLIIIGLVVIYNTLVGYLVVLPAFFFAYYCIVLAEEEFLRRKFGPDYDDYCREVNRFIPTPGKMRWVFEGGYFDMKRVIRKDYTSAFYWFILALAMMGWEAVAHQGWEASRGRLEVLGGIWAAGLVVWIIARVLKARKILASPD